MKHFFTGILLFLSVFVTAQNNFALAENYSRNNEFEKALQIYEKLVKKSPYNTTYLQRLVSTYQELNKFSSVDSLLNKKKEKYPMFPFFDVMLGYNFERQQQQKKAQKYYRKAIHSIQKKPNYTTVIANLFKSYIQLDLAILAYNTAMAKNPKLNYDIQKAQIYGEKGDFNQMFESYIALLDTDSKYLKTVQRNTARYITNDATNQTNIAFKKALLRKSTSNPKAAWNILLSWLFTQQKDYNKAFIQEKALYTRNTENLNRIILLGKIAHEDKDYETAKKCFHFILNKTTFPTQKIKAHVYLLNIAIKEKQPNIEDRFTTVFKEFGKNSNTIPIQVAYADYLTFTKNKPEQAKIILEEATNNTTNKFEKARVKLKLADVLVFTSQFNKALIYYSQIQTQLKNHILAQEARFKVARTSYFKGDFNWAKAQLKVLKGATSQLIANDAVALFLTISDNQPQDSIPTGLKELAKADLLAFQNKNKEALLVIEGILNAFNGQTIIYEALFKKGKLLVKLKQYKEAIVAFSKIIIHNTEGIYNDDAYYEMAELYNKLNQPQKAQEYYQKIIFEHPSSIYLIAARKQFRKLRGDSIK